MASIKEGNSMSCIQEFLAQAYTAVEAAAKFLDGQKLPALIPVDLGIVTKENVEKYLRCKQK
jgi:ABC-type sugar transport system substrate-binding protein